VRNSRNFPQQEADFHQFIIDWKIGAVRRRRMSVANKATNKDDENEKKSNRREKII
jgi:hypothetical protein